VTKLFFQQPIENLLAAALDVQQAWPALVQAAWQQARRWDNATFHWERHFMRAWQQRDRGISNNGTTSSRVAQG